MKKIPFDVIQKEKIVTKKLYEVFEHLKLVSKAQKNHLECLKLLYNFLFFFVFFNDVIGIHDNTGFVIQIP